MRNYFKSLKANSGFTLIELLVVIGILGVLAAALIATIDPFEQIKKAQDANTKNTTVEFVNASIRYYSTHNFLPWDGNSGVSGCGTSATLAANNSCLGAYITDGELKQSFTTSNIIGNINYIGDSAGVTACFHPLSKSQWRDPNTIYGANGVTTIGCASGGSACYWCSK
jgi:prepilin-type N-terminal cleavage/methylation domain-containing protein